MLDFFLTIYDSIIAYFAFWGTLFSSSSWYLLPFIFLLFFMVTFTFLITGLLTITFFIFTPLYLILLTMQLSFNFEFPIIGKKKKKEGNKDYKLNDNSNKVAASEKFKDVNPTQIIRDFGNFITKNPKAGVYFYDTKFLPYPKDTILTALLMGIKATEHQDDKNNMKGGLLTFLPRFQDDVGDEPISTSPALDIYEKGVNIFDVDYTDKNHLDKIMKEYSKSSEKNKEKLKTLHAKFFSDVEKFKILLEKLDNVP